MPSVRVMLGEVLESSAHLVLREHHHNGVGQPIADIRAFCTLLQQRSGCLTPTSRSFVYSLGHSQNLPLGTKICTFCMLIC